MTRPIEHLLRAIEAWRGGDQKARTGMSADRGELAAVGAAIDGLMDELALRQEHQKLLVNELNHRVKNTLAIVQSVAMQTFHAGTITAESRATFVSRLMALSKAQDVLTRVDWEGADLEQIVREAVEPHCGEDRARFEVKGPRITLPPRMALSFALALHELCTNAAKYGGFSKAGGRVSVEWLLVMAGSDRRLHMTWRESGGPIVELPTRRGFGSRLIQQGLARELNGEIRVDYDPAGVVCTVDVPIPLCDEMPASLTEKSEQPGATELSASPVCGNGDGR